MSTLSIGKDITRRGYTERKQVKKVCSCDKQLLKVE
jgi:hypothetical protein